MSADQYGFKAVASASVMTFDNQMRASGRTTRLLDQVSDGDLIICSQKEERRHYERKLKERGVKADVIVIENLGIEGVLLNRPRSVFARRVHYSHLFVMKYFLMVLDDAAGRLSEIQETYSHEAPEDPPMPRYGFDASL